MRLVTGVEVNVLTNIDTCTNDMRIVTCQLLLVLPYKVMQSMTSLTVARLSGVVPRVGEWTSAHVLVTSHSGPQCETLRVGYYRLVHTRTVTARIYTRTLE